MCRYIKYIFVLLCVGLDYDRYRIFPKHVKTNSLKAICHKLFFVMINWIYLFEIEIHFLYYYYLFGFEAFMLLCFVLYKINNGFWFRELSKLHTIFNFSMAFTNGILIDLEHIVMNHSLMIYHRHHHLPPSNVNWKMVLIHIHTHTLSFTITLTHTHSQLKYTLYYILCWYDYNSYCSFIYFISRHNKINIEKSFLHSCLLCYFFLHPSWNLLLYYKPQKCWSHQSKVLSCACFF